VGPTVTHIRSRRPQLCCEKLEHLRKALADSTFYYKSNWLWLALCRGNRPQTTKARYYATPAFSIQNLRAFAPIVFEKGFKLRNRWRDIIDKNGGDEAVLDVCLWVSRATFDVIGSAGSCSIPSHMQFDTNDASGFDYEFNSIEDDTNELFCAYREMFELAVSQQQNPMRQLLRIYFPITDVLFVSEYRQILGVFHPYRCQLSRIWQRRRSRSATR
jgi:hypothetical protein